MNTNSDKLPTHGLSILTPTFTVTHYRFLQLLLYRCLSFNVRGEIWPILCLNLISWPDLLVFVSKVLFWEGSSGPTEPRRVRTVGATTALLSGLKGNTVYLISVRAENSAGFGPASPAFNVTTKKPRGSLHTHSVPFRLKVLPERTSLFREFHSLPGQLWEFWPRKKCPLPTVPVIGQRNNSQRIIKYKMPAYSTGYSAGYSILSLSGSFSHCLHNSWVVFFQLQIGLRRISSGN